MARKALIVGATGLVGARLLGLLLEDPAYETVLRPLRFLLPPK